jgi:hypothetical protein
VSQRTTESDQIGDVWTAKNGRPDLTVVDKFNDWCLTVTGMLTHSQMPDGTWRMNTMARRIVVLAELEEWGYTPRRRGRPQNEAQK